MNKGSWLKHCQSIKHKNNIGENNSAENSDKGWRPKFIRNQVKPTKVTYSNEECFHCIFCNEVKKNTSESTVDVKAGSKVIQIKICETCLMEHLAPPGDNIEQNFAPPRG